MRQFAFGVFGLAVVTASLSQPATATGFGGGSTDLQVGGIVVVKPKYEGSKDYEVVGAPFVAPAFGPGGLDGEGRVQVKGLDDVRFRLFQYSGFEIGPVAGYRFGREEDDTDRLEGLGDVDGGFVAGGYAAYRSGPFAAFVSYGHQVSGDDGGALLAFGVEGKAPITPWLVMTATIGATYADDDYMAAYFGVTPGQAGPLAAFDADAGIKDISFGLNGDVALSDNWSLKLGGKYSRLVGDAADSPIVETEDQFTGTLGLSYRFTWQR